MSTNGQTVSDSSTNGKTSKEKKPKEEVPAVGLRKGILVLPYGTIYAAQAVSEQHFRVKTHGKDETMVGTIDMNDVPIDFVKALVRKDLEAPFPIPDAIKKALREFLGRTPEEVLSTRVSDAHEAYSALRFLTNSKRPVVEFELNGHWYPVPVSIQFYRGWFFTECSISINAQVQDQSIDKRFYIADGDFRDSSGTQTSKKVSDVLKELGLRFTTEERVKALREKAMRADAMAGRAGLMVDVAKSVLVSVNVGWRAQLVPYSIGSSKSVQTLIIENELEVDRDISDRSGDRVYALPFVRAFSTKLKRFVYVDVDDVKEHVYNDKVRDLLVLPQKLRRALNAIFDTKPEDVFGDLFEGRHGGVVVLATGGPGVGKTLTAEVYAESMKRPLYVLELGELGTSLQQVEEHLQNVFDRARRWNAVLLFDEADIFLSKREENDLEKSAIVGTFLRLLDHYEGTFFLTTNREEVIDDAFRSRITLRLAYPNLEVGSRSRVWAQLLQVAGLEFNGDMSTLATEDLNGRNIRNAVRVIKMLNPGKTVVTMEEITEALGFISRPAKSAT